MQSQFPSALFYVLAILQLEGWTSAQCTLAFQVDAAVVGFAKDKLLRPTADQFDDYEAWVQRTGLSKTMPAWAHVPRTAAATKVTAHAFKSTVF
jgi:hypothetical protein